ncbi:DUF418 domain-containing protein [Streptomyces flavotricini]
MTLTALAVFAVQLLFSRWWLTRHTATGPWSGCCAR